MASSIFSTRYDPQDKAFFAGKRPSDDNQLGIFPYGIDDPRKLNSPFVQPKFNPNYAKIYQTGQFTDDVAAQSQQKIDDSYFSGLASFPDENTNKRANTFLQGYAAAVANGFIPKEQHVGPENLMSIISQDAASKIARKDPNTKGDFPSQGVSV